MVTVILEFHATFFPFILQILPMLSVLLTVEELESLMIPYCHVFENHLHFLAFVTSVALQLLFIIIKSWFQSFIISSSPTSSCHCRCLIFHKFSFNS
jgi:hypothetical protein